MQGDLYESLYGFWTGQEREEFSKSLISSQLLGWASYLVRLAILILISHSYFWDEVLSYFFVFWVNVCTTIIWRQLGKNNIATLAWMCAPLIALGFCQPVISPFSRETLFGGILFFHIMGTVKYPLNMVAVQIIKRVAKKNDAVEGWLDTVLALSLFYHLHLYCAVLVMVAQFFIQCIIALLEVLGGLHSAVLLNSRMVGGVLLQQCAPMRKTYHGVTVHLQTLEPSPRVLYVPTKK